MGSTVVGPRTSVGASEARVSGEAAETGAPRAATMLVTVFEGFAVPGTIPVGKVEGEGSERCCRGGVVGGKEPGDPRTVGPVRKRPRSEPYSC